MKTREAVEHLAVLGLPREIMKARKASEAPVASNYGVLVDSRAKVHVGPWSATFWGARLLSEKKP